jgi:hypothetical protein
MEPTNGDKDLSFEKLKLDYEKTTTYFQSLHDTRFKLLGLLPLISGASIFVTPNLNSKFEIAFGLFGIIVILGITIYDQRNNMIYDRLTRRAAFLEMKMGFPPLPTDKKGFGGPFSSRPGRRKLIGINLIWHDLALAMIYSASFAIWIFILCNGIYHTWGLSLAWRILLVCGLTLIYFCLYIRLVKQNDIDNNPFGKALSNPGPKPGT